MGDHARTDGTEACVELLHDRRPMKRLRLLDLQEVGEHRNVFCAEYDTCLDEVLESGWPNWSCESCPFFLGMAALQECAVHHEAQRRPGAISC